MLREGLKNPAIDPYGVVPILRHFRPPIAEANRLLRLLYLEEVSGDHIRGLHGRGQSYDGTGFLGFLGQAGRHLAPLLTIGESRQQKSPQFSVKPAGYF